MGPVVERTAVDGVPVLWANGPEPYVGALVFRAGQADETLATSGLSHFVEHLALFTAGRRKFEVNGMVDDSTTVFWGSGTREEVCGFLSDIAQALGSLSLERLETERRVLLTEAQARAPHPLGILLGCRFGHAGFGLANSSELGLYRCSADEIAAWARERFTSGNAVVWLSGPPADGFSVQLPAGARCAPPEPSAIPGVKLPAHAEIGSGAVLLSFLTPRAAAASAAARLAGERVEEDLRTGVGLSYAAGASYWPLTATMAQVSLRADCLDEHAAETRDRMLAELRLLADHGPTVDELADHVTWARRTWNDPRAVTAFLDLEARNLLLGADEASPQETFAEVAALTREEIAAVLRDSLPSMLVVSPERTPPPADGFVPYATETEHSVRVDGVAYAVKGTGGWRKTKNEIVAGDDGISFVDNQNDVVVTIRRDDVVALLSYGAGRFTVVGSTGADIDAGAPGLENGDELVEHLRRSYGDRLVPLEDVDGTEAVERVASLKLKRRWTVTEEVALLPSTLAPGESIVTLAEVSRRTKTGILAVTERRVFFVSKGLTARGNRFLEFPLEEIESVESGEGIRGIKSATIQIRVGGEVHKFADVTPRELAFELADAIRARAGLASTE